MNYIKLKAQKTFAELRRNFRWKSISNDTDFYQAEKLTENKFGKLKCQTCQLSTFVVGVSSRCFKHGQPLKSTMIKCTILITHIFLEYDLYALLGFC